MELSLDSTQASYQILGYHYKSIIVNNQTHSCPLIVMPEYLIAPWGSPTLSLETLQWNDFLVLLPFRLQVVLLGTGSQQQKLDKTLIQKFKDEKIGLEVMNTGAACRTYTLLTAENRQVAACLFL